MQSDESNPHDQASPPPAAPRGAVPVRPIPYFNDARQQSYVPFDYAGFGMRLLAFLIDGAICYLPREGIRVAVDRMFGLAMKIRFTNLQGKQAAALGAYFAIGMVFQWLYGALFESSRKQGTPGKMICRIKVTDLRGNRITFARATGRHFAKIPSGAICYLGYLKALEEPRHQALHDQWAGTVVLKASGR